MNLLIIRHADAGDANEFAKTGAPDSERPLSEKGRAQMADASKTLASLVPKIDLLATSPYTRAVQTAEIVLKRYEGTARETTETLVPDADPGEFVRWLRAQGSHDVAAAVGHEPHLSTLASWLVAASDDSRLELKKGGACLIAFDRLPAKGEGVLQWLMTGKQLAKLK